jgi:hypothetical protein
MRQPSSVTPLTIFGKFSEILSITPLQTFVLGSTEGGGSATFRQQQAPLEQTSDQKGVLTIMIGEK